MHKLRWISLFLLIAVCGSVFSVSATEPPEAADGVLNYTLESTGTENIQDFITNVLPERIGGDAEWYAMVLARKGAYDFSAYAEALVNYVNENTVTNAVTKQKYAFALLASGYTSDFVQKTADECVGKLGVMSLVWALHLAENGFVPKDMSKSQILERLLSAELATGGFAVVGKNFDTDVTAMALQALAPYREAEAVRGVIERGLSLLSAQQTESGGFRSYGEENAESSAQVLIMMSCLDIGLDDPRFVKNGNTVLDSLLSYRCENGGFAHTAGGEANESASVQAYLALYVHQNGSFYSLDNTEDLQEIVYSAESDDQKLSWRVYACSVIAALVLIAFVLLTVRKKRRLQNYLLVLLIGAVLCILVFTLKLESADGYYGDGKPKENIVGTVTLEIRCDVIAGSTDLSYVPADGVILPTTEFSLAQGESVFDILDEAARKYRIHTEHDGSEKMAYVRGIGYIYELQHGDLSGWVYFVNGESPSVGCGSYILSDGDSIVWHYSLAQGNDIAQ